MSAAPAFARLPEGTIRHIVDLQVRREKTDYLLQSGQINAGMRSSRQSAIEAELRTLYRQIDRLPPDDRREARSQIDAMTKAGIAALAPQFPMAQRTPQNPAVRESPPAAAPPAVEPERGRIASNPANTPAKPKLPSVQGGTSADDYQRDARRVAEIAARRNELSRRLHITKDITPTAFRLADKPLDTEMAGLLRKWYAAGRGSEFERDYRQPPPPWGAEARGRGGTSRATTRPTLPPPPGPPNPGEDEYQYDVRLAEYVNAILVSLNQRYFSNDPKRNVDIELWLDTDKNRRQELQTLRQKWQARGKGSDFDRDFQRGAPTPQPLPRWWQRVDGLKVISIPVGLAAGLYLLHLLFRRGRTGKRRVSTVYGTAHYAPLETDIADAACLSKGIFLGKSSAPEYKGAALNAPGAPVCSTPEHHTLIVARTRTGKGTRVIVPTLLRYDGSALVIDPKGENAAITAAIRRDQLGQSIHILNPWDVLAATYERRGFTRATYNPLDILDRHDPNAVAIARTLAGAICPSSNAKDTYWQGSAANILAAVFLWLAETAREKKTLARAREIVSLTRQKFTKEFLIPMAASDAFSGAIREYAAQFIDLAQETYSGVMSNLNQSTGFLSDPQTKAVTAQSSFSMEALATSKTTVYVVIPTGTTMDTQKTWLRLMIAAAMHTFKTPVGERRGRGHRCLFLIDEFPALGRLDDLPRDIATMSGFGVDFALIVQGLDQLKAHYGEAKGTILSNCAYKWFCDVGDLDSAKYLSDTLGKTTVETTSTSTSSSTGHGGGSSGSSVSHGETGRLLLTPDEILNLGKNVAIGIQPDGHPHYLKPVDYWDLAEAFSSLREKHPKLYWQPPLAFDENPYFQKSTGEKTRSERTRSDGIRMWDKRARDILQVGPEAGPEEILAAYRRLQKRVHPDVGGSNYLAEEVNAAKAFLLGD